MRLACESISINMENSTDASPIVHLVQNMGRYSPIFSDLIENYYIPGIQKPSIRANTTWDRINFFINLCDAGNRKLCNSNFSINRTMTARNNSTQAIYNGKSKISLACMPNVFVNLVSCWIVGYSICVYVFYGVSHLINNSFWAFSICASFGRMRVYCCNGENYNV